MHDLKTGSYTVRGPVALGAALAGASANVAHALDAYARPLGIAFQLRDDLLGSFGDPKTTGKPVGTDLRRGKQTALIVALRGDAEGARIMDRVLGVEDAPQDEVDALLARIVASGAKARVEARLEALVAEATRALGAVTLAPDARAVLDGAAAALGIREY